MMLLSDLSFKIRGLIQFLDVASFNFSEDSWVISLPVQRGSSWMAYPGAQRSSKNKIKTSNIFVFISSALACDCRKTHNQGTYIWANQKLMRQQNNKQTRQRKCQCKQVCHAKKSNATYRLFWEDIRHKGFPSPCLRCCNKFLKERRRWSIPHNDCLWFLSNTVLFSCLKINNVKNTLKHLQLEDWKIERKLGVQECTWKERGLVLNEYISWLCSFGLLKLPLQILPDASSW